ncbi:MAG: hypothetical protein R3C59_12230 [Planctomycetaceae bacterium]
MNAEPLSASQLSQLETAFRHGAEDASDAMAKWLSVPSLITLESVEQRLLNESIEQLGAADMPVCFCMMAITGTLTGHLILSFDDASGLALADLLLSQPAGTSTDWGEVEQSAALESHNIIGCAYLNSLARHLPGESQPPLHLVPSPPDFRRDFAESLLQSAFTDQALAGDLIFVAKARFELRGQPLMWTLLFVPDAVSMDTLKRILTPAVVSLSEDAE